MHRTTDEAPLRARVPADVEKADRIAFGLTARQLVILTVTGLVLYAAWTALATTVHPAIFLAASLPIAGAAFFLAVGRRDGLPLDMWLLAGLRHRRAPYHLVPADTDVRPAPAWVATTSGPSDRLPLPAPLRLPAKGITHEGAVDLGPDGATALVEASTVAFGLRTAAEQNGLVAAFARWLHSLDGPTQVLVRARPVDLRDVADRIDARAPALPHPALEDAARSHVAFLDALGQQRELLHRHVTVAVRSERGPAHAAHRAAEAVRALSGCDVPAALLHGPSAAAVLGECLDPSRPSPHAASPSRLVPQTGEYS
jgi:hypothetical protein